MNFVLYGVRITFFFYQCIQAQKNICKKKKNSFQIKNSSS